MSENNIYQKLAGARLALSTTKMKKSGKNSFAHYEYFELADFLPAICKIATDVGILPVFTFNEEKAVLTVFDSNKPEENIVFSCGLAEAGIKGASSIQNLGGQITYLRRYLYQMAFDISESDAVDSLDNKDKKPAATKPVVAKPAPVTITKITQEQIDKIISETIRTGTDISGILAYGNVGNIQDIAQDKVTTIIATLAKKPSLSTTEQQDYSLKKRKI